MTWLWVLNIKLKSSEIFVLYIRFPSCSFFNLSIWRLRFVALTFYIQILLRISVRYLRNIQQNINLFWEASLRNSEYKAWLHTCLKKFYLIPSVPLSVESGGKWARLRETKFGIYFWIWKDICKKTGIKLGLS